MRWGIECGKCKRTHTFLEWFGPSEYNIIHSFFSIFLQKNLGVQSLKLEEARVCVVTEEGLSGTSVRQY
jgi:hypothetical protein